MSEFRIFCTTVFVAVGLACAADNRGAEIRDGAAGIVMIALMIGCIAVMLFGKKAK